MIKSIFEKVILLKNYSWSQIDIHICVVENDGSMKSAAINAACLALVDAGIALKELVISINAGFLLGQEPALDLLESEEWKHSNSCDFTLAYLPSSDKIAYLELETKKLSYDDTKSLIMKGIEGAKWVNEIVWEIINYELWSLQLESV